MHTCLPFEAVSDASNLAGSTESQIEQSLFPFESIYSKLVSTDVPHNDMFMLNHCNDVSVTDHLPRIISHLGDSACRHHCFTKIRKTWRCWRSTPFKCCVLKPNVQLKSYGQYKYYQRSEIQLHLKKYFELFFTKTCKHDTIFRSMYSRSIRYSELSFSRCVISMVQWVLKFWRKKWRNVCQLLNSGDIAEKQASGTKIFPSNRGLVDCLTDWKKERKNEWMGAYRW